MNEGNARVVDFPRPAHVTMGELLDGYATAYTGNDHARISTLACGATGWVREVTGESLSCVPQISEATLEL